MHYSKMHIVAARCQLHTHEREIMILSTISVVFVFLFCCRRCCMCVCVTAQLQLLRVKITRNMRHISIGKSQPCSRGWQNIIIFMIFLTSKAILSVLFCFRSSEIQMPAHIIPMQFLFVMHSNKTGRQLAHADQFNR